MTHGCGACLALVIIILVILVLAGIVLSIIHPEVVIKLKEIWSILGELWAVIR